MQDDRPPPTTEDMKLYHALLMEAYRRDKLMRFINGTPIPASRAWLANFEDETA